MHMPAVSGPLPSCPPSFLPACGCTQVHLESANIIRWVDDAFEGPPLVPGDAAAQRDMDALLRGACSEVVSAGLDLMAGETRAGRTNWRGKTCRALAAPGCDVPVGC